MRYCLTGWEDRLRGDTGNSLPVSEGQECCLAVTKHITGGTAASCASHPGNPAKAGRGPPAQVM